MFNGIVNAQDEETSALKNAQEAEQNKDIETALKWYKVVSKLQPNNATYYYDIAWCNNELKQYEDAVKAARNGIRIMPSADLYKEEAYALLSLEKYEESIVVYKKALLLNKEDIESLKGIADAYYYLKDYINAEMYYLKNCALGNENATINYRLGYIKNETKKFEEAILYFRKVVKREDDYAEAYNEMGYAYDMLGQNEEAIDNYLKAFNLNSQNEIYAANIASLYFNGKGLVNLDKSLAYYQKSLTIRDRNELSNYRVGWILNEKEKYEEALKYLQRAVEIYPEFTAAWIDLGWANLQLKNYKVAENNLQKALKFDKSSDLAVYYLGQLFLEINKKEKAKKMLEKLKSMQSEYYDKLKEIL